MTKRSVELSIELQNAKSIGDLEKVLKDINTELKQVDVNSDAFKDLSNSAKQANGSLQDVKDELKTISSEKQLDSVAKLGGSLAAGLSVATLAASKFGEQSKENITKAIQTATELSVVVGSIKPLLEGLSSTNRKAFGEFVSGFKQAGIGAKLFGSTTATAIASTGIGLLVIGLGLLISNWEAVTKAVKDFGNSIPFIKLIIDGVDSLIEKVGSLGNLFNAVGAFIKGVFTSGASAVDEFNKALESGKAIEALEAQSLIIKEQNIERERTIKLLEAQGKKEQEINNLKIESSKSELQNLNDLQSAGKELSKEQLARIKDLQLELDILEVRGKQIADADRKAAWLKANVEAEFRLAKIEADRQASQESAEKQKEVLTKLYEELKEKFKEYKYSEAEIEDLIVQGQAEKEISVKVQTLTQEKALIENFNAVKVEQEKSLQKKILNERIKILEETTNKTEEQEEVLKQLKVQKLKETIEEITPFIQTGLNAINTISQALTESLQRQLDSLKLELDIVNTRFQESVSNRMAMEAQLADAQGARRDALLQSIEEERQKELKLAADRKRIQNEQIKAQNKQQEIQWINSLVNAVTAGALAVVEALPNVPLSIAVGILSAIQTGIIAGNKPTPLPLMFTGGHTVGQGFTDASGHEVAGVVHANEYVVPERVLGSSMGGQLVQALEAMRLGYGSFASGGFTSSVPSLSPNVNSNAFTPETLRSIVESSKIFVSAQEVSDKQTNVQVIESRAAA